MGKYVIFLLFHIICNFLLVLFFILHGNPMFSLAYNNYLDPLYIYTKFQVPIIDFEFSTGEM